MRLSNLPRGQGRGRDSNPVRDIQRGRDTTVATRPAQLPNCGDLNVYVARYD